MTKLNVFILIAILFSVPVYAAPMERPTPDGRLNPAEAVEMRITYPEMDQVMKDSRVEVKFELSNFEIKDDGPHLHYVLDNGSIREHFSPDDPIVLTSLSVGTHVLAVFPVTTWHESWKDKESLAIVVFHIKEKSHRPPLDIEKPILIFNMPQGTVKRWNDRWVLFDFVVANVKIAKGDTRIEDYRVLYILDGAKSLAEYYESRFWLNVEDGTHKIGVQLVDKKGEFVPNGNWNRAVRTFRVE